MIDAYLNACKETGERPREDLAAALGDSGQDACFRLTSMALVSISASDTCTLKRARARRPGALVPA